MPRTATRKTTASKTTTPRAAPRKRAEATQVEAKATRAQDKQTERSEETQVHQGPGGLTLHTHTYHPPMPVPYLTRKDLAATARAATSMLPGMAGRPQGKDLLFYGGLGAMTVAGALEWPVALAVGGATWLVRSKRKEERRAGMESREESGSRRPAGRAA
ncbi:hypothetical protein ABT009_04055 [Streptomyces sp. NPDC002896]|uniref:hypothetical protein n=1 Tax=Streptomyces sp. NPDC002896 TaxID=3154438 RepID=UPI00331B2556